MASLSERVSYRLSHEWRRGRAFCFRMWCRVVSRLSSSGRLELLARAYRTDKEGAHFYTRHYQNHFRAFRWRRFNLLEIGIGGYDDTKRGGESLRMWKAFFPRALIYGIDLYNKSAQDETRIKTFQGSQVDEAFLRSVAAQIGKIEIVIDDGSHFNDHVIETFRILFPLLAEGGIYVIEDLQTSYWEHLDGVDWKGSADRNAPQTSMNFLKSLIDGLNFEEFVDNEYVPTYYDRHIVAMHFYHNLAFIVKGQNREGSNVLGQRFWN